MPLPDANPHFWKQFLLSIGAVIAVGAATAAAAIACGPYAVMLLWRLREYAELLAEAVGWALISLPFIALGLLWYLIWKKPSGARESSVREINRQS